MVTINNQIAPGRNHVWANDFVFDRTHDGRVTARPRAAGQPNRRDPRDPALIYLRGYDS